MSISTVPGSSTCHNYGQESGECCRYADTGHYNIITPQTPGCRWCPRLGLIFSRERCLIRWRTSHSVRWSYSPTQRNEFLIVLLTNLCPMKVFGPQSSLLCNSAEGECWMCQIRSESPLVLTKLRCPLNQLPLALPSIANLTNLSKVSTWHLLKTWKNWSFYSSQVPFRILRQVTCAKEVEFSQLSKPFIFSWRLPF